MEVITVAFLLLGLKYWDLLICSWVVHRACLVFTLHSWDWWESWWCTIFDTIYNCILHSWDRRWSWWYTIFDNRILRTNGTICFTVGCNGTICLVVGCHGTICWIIGQLCTIIMLGCRTLLVTLVKTCRIQVKAYNCLSFINADARLQYIEVLVSYIPLWEDWCQAYISCNITV